MYGGFINETHGARVDGTHIVFSVVTFFEILWPTPLYGAHGYAEIINLSREWN